MAKTAIPLILPNNCSWDEQTGEYTKYMAEERQSLNIIPKALEMLREIKTPVCVVSIAGPCRKGKSYILSKAFDQGEIFPLGHLLDPETMGIWLWVVDRKFQDKNGQEFTVVLLDSEGIDAIMAKKTDDHRVFTLSVLLASIMIYNSAGVPSRNDLEGLDFIVKLSQRVQLHSGQSQAHDASLLYKTFPYFVWLLRDVVLDLPANCATIKDYFLKKVFTTESGHQSSQERAQVAAESILKFFPGFDAFMLPPPSVDPKVVKNLNDKEVEDKVNEQFLIGVEEFKHRLHDKLKPKSSYIEGEFVTGEALAVLIQLYVEALNTPGTVPNVQSAWETFVHGKCTEVKIEALRIYEQEMTSRVQELLPCESDVIRQAHLDALDASLAMFRAETFGISAVSVDKYLSELTETANSGLSKIMNENKRQTEEFCYALLKELKKEHLDPVLARLRGPQGYQVQFAEIIASYTAIEQHFQNRARGAKDVCATVFFAFHPELQQEMEKHMDQLQTLKDYDENLAKEKERGAALEEHRQRIEEEKARLIEEQKIKEKEIQLMMEKQEEDRIRLQEQFEENMRNQREQMMNMMEANQDELRKEREMIVAQNRTMEDMVTAMKENMESKNEEMGKLHEMLIEIVNRPPPAPVVQRGPGCIIL